MKQVLKLLWQVSADLKISVYLVGGTVRDWLLSLEVTDFDCLAAGDAKKLAAEYAQLVRGSMFPLDEERKIYRVISKYDDQLYQFDFSACDQAFLQDNLAQRDFTINAMALPLAESLNPAWRSKIIDPFGGRKDLENKVLAAAGEGSLKADPLRILRAARFAAKYDLTVSEKTVRAAKMAAGEEINVSAERIRDEFMQILGLPNSSAAVKLLDNDFQALDLFFPEVKEMKGVEQGPYHKYDVWGHCLETLAHFEENISSLGMIFPEYCRQLADYLHSGVTGDRPLLSILKFVCLFHDLGKPRVLKLRNNRISFIGHERSGARLAEILAKRLRMSQKEIKLITLLINAHMRPLALAKSGQLTKKAVYRFFRDLGANGLGVLLISLADKQSSCGPLTTKAFLGHFQAMIGEMLDLYLKRPEEIFPPALISALELKEEFGVPPGPVYKSILQGLTEQQVVGKVKNEQEAREWVLKYLKKFQ